MLSARHLLDIFLCWGMARIVMVVAVRLRYRVMRVRLIVLQLISVVLPKCRVEIFLLVGPGNVSRDTPIAMQWVCLLVAHQPLYQDLFLLAMP